MARRTWTMAIQRAVRLFDQGATFMDIQEEVGITEAAAISAVMDAKHLGRCELCECLVPSGVVFCDDCRVETMGDMGELIKANSPTNAAIEAWGRIGVDAAHEALVGEVA